MHPAHYCKQLINLLPLLFVIKMYDSIYIHQIELLYACSICALCVHGRNGYVYIVRHITKYSNFSSTYIYYPCRDAHCLYMHCLVRRSRRTSNQHHADKHTMTLRIVRVESTLFILSILSPADAFLYTNTFFITSFAIKQLCPPTEPNHIHKNWVRWLRYIELAAAACSGCTYI